MHIVDRRLNPGGKSLENRQRFLRRAKAQVKQAVRKATEGRDIKEVVNGGQIAIPLDGLDEPHFGRNGGLRDMVLPGNTQYVEGDYLDRPDGRGQGKTGGQGEGMSEDAFRFVLSREEFMDLFLEDLELPDLAKKQLAETESEGIKRAGYTTTGSPANVSISRTVGRALARRIALGRPSSFAIEQAEAELAACKDEKRRAELSDEVERLKAKAGRIPYIDPIDVRYRRFEPSPKPISKAVMFCLMDVSGSVTEHMKDLAKRFYMLLYVFLVKRYGQVEIVFIRHTDEAQEVDEQTFFHDPASGATMVSSALACMRDVVRARFNPADWNIYVAQASDGDNAYSDRDATAALARDAILPLVQYFAYLEVGNGPNSHAHMGYDDGDNETELWKLYQGIVDAGAPLAMRKVSDRTQIFPVFRELFAKKAAGQTERIAS